MDAPADDSGALLDDDDGDELAAPPVVAVLVTHDPGPWFEEVLAAWADQDYPALSILVIDAGSADDVRPRIAQVLPGAYVRRLDENPGFGPAANDVLDVVEGAAFYAICHDDVALEPNAISTMVTEAYRSNAGVVGPKLVRWEAPERLLQVGMSADKSGAPAALAEPGELDQEQHDAVRDVFYLPGGCTLVRADLFAALGGFDPAIALLGEDLDLCWRAQVAGARVLVAPSATARHLEALGHRREVDDRRRLQARHRLRTMLTCYSPLHLVRVVPQAAALALVEIVYALVTGRIGQARDVAGAWTWNFSRRSEIAENRRRLKAVRQIPDSEVRRQQVRGSARFAAFLRGQIGRGDDRLRNVTAASREIGSTLRAGPARAVLTVWVAVALVLVVGSRGMFGGNVALLDLPAFPDRPWSLFSEWFSGWRRAGLGSEAPAPTAFGLLGSAGVVAIGSMSVVRRLLVVLPFAVGALGAWRLPRATDSRWARVVALLVYVAIPLPYDAVANGRWSGLLAWAVSPWLLGRMARATADEPFDIGGSVRRQVLGLGLLLAVAAAFVPVLVAVPLVAALGIFLGGVVSADARGAGRAFVVAVGGAVVAAVLHVPWTFDFVAPGSEWAAFGGVRASEGLPLSALLRFDVGPLGGSAFGWMFLGAGALPLLIARGWRLTWAVRAWGVAIVCWALAWAAQQVSAPVGLSTPEVLLAPAAAALALSAALGMVAFEVDLRGYRFGLRQMAAIVAAAALVVGMLPVLGGVVDGRWKAPSEGFDAALAFLDDDPTPSRVLWLGDASVIPLGSWELDDGLVYATTSGGLPELQDRWAGSADGPTRLIAEAVLLAESGTTARLGRLLAPMGIRYLVLPEAAAPFDSNRKPLPAALSRGLSEQLDLVRIDVDPAVVVYRNTAWAPTRAIVSDRAIDGSGSYFDTAAFLDLRGAPVALPDDVGHTGARGPLPPGSTVHLGSASSTGWHLTVDGEAADRRKSLGWANAFSTAAGGDAELSFRTPWRRPLLLVLQTVLWIAVISILRRARHEDAPLADVETAP